jgi:7-cyano-7-deazaguanine synthase
MKAVSLYSGGMDSFVLLNKYKSKIALALSFKYGSKHNNAEAKRAQDECARLGVERRVISLDFDNYGIKSDLLLSGGAVPHGHYQDKTMVKTVVPFRNGIMISIAISVAESIGASHVLIANHAGDHEIYPDCREGFISSMRAASVAGTYAGVDIYAPFTNITKREIALIGRDMGLDFSRSYSCYEGDETHCGKCGTCTERKEALAGFDNTQYKA